jgi:secondary thiamine-phosphate synthase enzyme
MKIYQQEIKLKSYSRGFHIITDSIIHNLPQKEEIQKGILQVFIKHTSASLTINENWDHTVRGDFERHLNLMVPENAPYYKHNYEGSDGMPAHIKASLLGSSIQIPITDGVLNLGTWQGIYLCEHRDSDLGRSLVLTVWGI